jgi:hypothetical protein
VFRRVRPWIWRFDDGRREATTVGDKSATPWGPMVSATAAGVLGILAVRISSVVIGHPKEGVDIRRGYDLMLTADPDVPAVCRGSCVAFTATLACTDPANPVNKLVFITVEGGDGPDASDNGSASTTVCSVETGVKKIGSF